MKLIGSVMEADFRKELVESHQYHFSASSKSRLKQILEKAGYSTERAYVLHWTPDQTEDIFTVLIDGEYLVSTEIDKFDFTTNSAIEREEIKSYIHGMSRMHQVRLAVAQDLANDKT
jgi:hypothetical protein